MSKFVDTKVCLSFDTHKQSVENLSSKREKKTTVSTDILGLFLRSGNISAFRTYLISKTNKSGKLNLRKLEELGLDQKKCTTMKHLSQITALGLGTRTKNGWYYFKGIKTFNIENGTCYPKMVEVPFRALSDTKSLRSFCRSVQFSMAAKKASSKQSVKGCATENLPELSISYMARYAGVSERTVCRHKDTFIKFKKNSSVLEVGTAASIEQWKEYRVSHLHFVKSVGFGVFQLCQRGTNTVIQPIRIKKKRIFLTVDEKQLIRDRFHFSSLIPRKRSSITSQAKKESINPFFYDKNVF